MKKILLSLFGIITLGLINFGSCANFSDFITYISSDTVSINAGDSYPLLDISNSSDYGTYCVKINSLSNGGFFFGMNTSFGINTSWMNEMYPDWDFPIYSCAYVNVRYLLFSSRNYDLTVSYDLFKLNTLLDTPVPVMTSFECQQNYDLIPISSVDSNYCEINNLCPSGGGECIISGSGYSDIFIYSNNRYFPITGTNSVFINLPDYLNYNYDYSNGGDDLDIDIGYSVDNSYIENINNQQSYIPTSDDFTNVFGNIGTFGALLVVCLFVILVFYMIKKIFS